MVIFPWLWSRAVAFVFRGSWIDFFELGRQWSIDKTKYSNLGRGCKAFSFFLFLLLEPRNSLGCRDQLLGTQDAWLYGALVCMNSWEVNDSLDGGVGGRELGMSIVEPFIPIRIEVRIETALALLSTVLLVVPGCVVSLLSLSPPPVGISSSTEPWMRRVFCAAREGRSLAGYLWVDRERR